MAGLPGTALFPSGVSGLMPTGFSLVLMTCAAMGPPDPPKFFLTYWETRPSFVRHWVSIFPGDVDTPYMTSSDPAVGPLGFDPCRRPPPNLMAAPPPNLVLAIAPFPNLGLESVPDIVPTPYQAVSLGAKRSFNSNSVEDRRVFLA